MHQSVNVIGPAHKVIKFNQASELHCHNTRYAKHGNFYEGAIDIKDKKYFNVCFKKHMGTDPTGCDILEYSENCAF